MSINNLCFIVCLLFLSFQGAFAQNVPLYGGSASNYGIANATIAQSNEFSAINNQAGILNVDKWAFQAGAMNLYGIANLNAMSASGIYKYNNNNAFSLSIKHIGDSDLNTQLIGIAYARRLLKNWNISLQADLLSIQAKNFGSKFLPTLEIGSIYEVNKKVSVGFHVFNPFGQALTEAENVSAIFRLGCYYNLSKKVKLLAEFEKDILLPSRIKTGIIYNPIEKLAIKAGFNTQHSQFSFGLAYTFGKYTIHGASAIHPLLGLSTGGEISYKN